MAGKKKSNKKKSKKKSSAKTAGTKSISAKTARVKTARVKTARVKTARTGKSPAGSSRKKTSRAKTTAKRASSAQPGGAPKQVRAKTRKPGLLREPRKIEAFADQDSQGLSRAAAADSESVSELIDEGNSFEAGVVRGVEQADDAEGKEIRTREFPEDDVPEEYLDQD